MMRTGDGNRPQVSFRMICWIITREPHLDLGKAKTRLFFSLVIPHLHKNLQVNKCDRVSSLLVVHVVSVNQLQF